MRLEHYSVEKLKKQILSIINKHKETKDAQVFFFGSRVREDNFERADIDLGIQAQQKISSKTKFIIKEELENLPILYKIDFIDFNNVSSEFKQEALKNIEYVKK